jgi:hypothetical protein
MDLRYPPLSPTAAPMVVCQNSVCASLNPLTLGMPIPGIADSLLIVSMSTVKYKILATHIASVERRVASR